MVLEPGDEAPDFTLVDQHGEPFTLSRSLEQRRARHVVYFYPKADTAGCTAQACGLRDALPELGDVTVVGISPDLPAKQAAFDRKHALGHHLLSDPDHAVAEEYGTWGEKRLYGRTYQGILRSAFLIDERGEVAGAWYKVSPKDTVAKVRRALGG